VTHLNTLLRDLFYKFYPRDAVSLFLTSIKISRGSVPLSEAYLELLEVGNPGLRFSGLAGQLLHLLLDAVHGLACPYSETIEQVTNRTVRQGRHYQYY
jgi:hypothetical protein